MPALSLTLFESAVPYYARYRSAYPADDMAAIASAAGLDSSHTVLDIGCGTGQLAIPLSRHAGQVVAIDPVAGMLEHGRLAADAVGVRNIRWVRGSSQQLVDIVEPGAQLAVFAASFHWVDRVDVVDDLDKLLTPAGSILVINDDMDDAEQPAWAHAIAEVRSRYPGLTAQPGAQTSQRQTHRDVLRRSAFGDVHATTWSWTRRLSLDEVVGLQLSYSFSTPALLGDRLDAFIRDVRDAVLAVHPDEAIDEPYRVEALLARRPRP